ncbi:MAG: chemotaxis protein CheW [Gammaproteobacteria bacterium]|nr:chemotaxis protein CheW [Gammaproteobacteria bacterium]
MTDPQQFMRLQLGDTSYLLPSMSGFTIEQRENLITNKSPEGNVAAWRAVQNRRLPAYGLDAALRVARPPRWHRAVFLEASPQAVGLVVDEVQLLPRAETVISPFTPLGLPPTRLGHLFSGAWITGQRAILVFEPKALIAYLQSLGEE